MARYAKLLGTLSSRIDATGLHVVEADLVAVLLRSLPAEVRTFCLHHTGGESYQAFRATALKWEQQHNPPSAPESPFFCTLGTPAQQQCPPLSSILAQRTKEEWTRTLCENKAVAIMQRMQEGKPALIPKECEEILIAIVLDRPLAEAKRLVDNPEGFFDEILEALEAHRNHPVLMQLLQDMATPAASSNDNRPVKQQVAPPTQFQ